MSDISWIDLEGVVNMRDVGYLRTREGRALRPGRLIRSDNLQDLSDTDVRHLVDDVGVTDVVDLRSNHELHVTGPGPLRQTLLAHHHHSFLKDDAERAEDALAVAWREQPRRDDDYWASHYLGYLADRPDSVSAALDVVACSDGGTIVHCAAGKDRTGTVVGMALAVAGVPEEDIVADYVATSERLERIVARLVDKTPYSEVLQNRSLWEQMPQAPTMVRILTVLNERYGGVAGWLLQHGWTEDDVERLRHSLVE